MGCREEFEKTFVGDRERYLNDPIYHARYVVISILIEIKETRE